MDNDDAWFAPKRRGYGSGLPLNWQGWAFTAAHFGFAIGAGLLFKRTPMAGFATVVGITILAMPVYMAKTRGGWKWRDGSGRD